MRKLILLYMQKCWASLYETPRTHGTKMPYCLHVSAETETLWKMIWDRGRATQESAAVWMWLEDQSLLGDYPLYIG